MPGDAVDAIINDVLASTVPAVWGSTGFEWPEDLNRSTIHGFEMGIGKQL